MAKVGERTYDDGAFGCSSLAASDCAFGVFLDLGNGFNMSQTENLMKELTMSQSWEPWKVSPLSYFLPWVFREVHLRMTRVGKLTVAARSCSPWSV